jgi:hypothetical protein
MMEHTYQNGEVNISSDFGKDSRSGLFVDRDYKDITPLRLEAPKLEKIWLITPLNVFGWMKGARSFSRAWIHRERQLARRILHFTGNELVWECCGTERTSFASESLPGGAPFKDLFNADTKFQSGRLHESLTLGAQETYGVWNDSCERLSDKSVTHATDMPIILSSLAKEFHRMLPQDEYLAGLWKSTLPHGLAWCTKSYGVSKHKIYAPGDQSYIAPSWSWLSVSVPVTLALKTPHMRKVPIATVIETEIELGYDDPYGPVKYGALHLEGVLRSIQIDFDNNGRTFQLSVVDEQLCVDANDVMSIKSRCIGSSWREYEGDMCTLELDRRPETMPLRCCCLLTTIEWAQNVDSNYRNITCLLLQPVEKGNGVYKRIGMLTLEDMYSLEMRYAVDHGGEEDSASDEESDTSDNVGNEDVGETEESGDQEMAARTNGLTTTADGREIQLQDNAVSADLVHDVHLPGGATAEHKKSNAFESNEANGNKPGKAIAAKENSGGDLKEEIKDHDETVRGEDAVEEQQRETDDEDDGDIRMWNILLYFLRQKRWPIIEAAREERRAKEDEEEKERKGEEERESTSIDLASARAKGQENEGKAKDQVERSIADAIDGASRSTPETDAAEGADHGEETMVLQPGDEDYEVQCKDDPKHTKIAEGETPRDKEMENPEFDYEALRSTTPAWGRLLPPLEALYQFDDALDVIQREDGQFSWFKRLPTTKVTII